MFRLFPGLRHSWPIRVITLLLLLQAAGLIGLNLYAFEVVNIQPAGIDWAFLIETPYEALPPLEANFFNTLVGLLLTPLALPALLAAIGLAFLWRTGWLLAMLTQILVMAICLMLYMEFELWIIYPAMFYSAMMVLYLNMYEVRRAFPL